MMQTPFSMLAQQILRIHAVTWWSLLKYTVKMSCCYFLPPMDGQFMNSKFCLKNNLEIRDPDVYLPYTIFRYIFSPYSYFIIFHLLYCTRINNWITVSSPSLPPIYLYTYRLTFLPFQCSIPFHICSLLPFLSFLVYLWIVQKLFLCFNSTFSAELVSMTFSCRMCSVCNPHFLSETLISQIFIVLWFVM